MTNAEMRIACGKMSRQTGLVVDGISTENGWEIEILVPPHKHVCKVETEGWRGWDEISRLIYERVARMPYRRCSQCGEWDKKRQHQCEEAK